jgi:hypothetical protein
LDCQWSKRVSTSEAFEVASCELCGSFFSGCGVDVSGKEEMKQDTSGTVSHLFYKEQEHFSRNTKPTFINSPDPTIGRTEYLLPVSGSDST